MAFVCCLFSFLNVKGVAFRKGSHQLFSSSLDRTIKVWDVSQLAYVETLFGHQEGVTAVDSLSKERCVTAGGRDRTVRLWKIVEETQLVFRGDVESIDSLKLVNEDNFITGGDSGYGCLLLLSISFLVSCFFRQ